MLRNVYGVPEVSLFDTLCTLRTDSRNLTFINTAEEGRVFRWKIQIQKYNFDIEHIAGKL